MYLADSKTRFETAIYKLGEGEQVSVPDTLDGEWQRYIAEHVSVELYKQKLKGSIYYSTMPFKSRLR